MATEPTSHPERSDQAPEPDARASEEKIEDLEPDRAAADHVHGGSYGPSTKLAAPVVV